jgi:hypothetical protein
VRDAGKRACGARGISAASLGGHSYPLDVIKQHAPITADLLRSAITGPLPPAAPRTGARIERAPSVRRTGAKPGDNLKVALVSKVEHGAALVRAHRTHACERTRARTQARMHARVRTDAGTRDLTQRTRAHARTRTQKNDAHPTRARRWSTRSCWRG